MADGQSRRPDNIDPGSCLAFSGDSNALQQLLRWFVIWVLGNQFTAKGAGKERLSTCAHAFSCSPGTEHEDEGRARARFRYFQCGCSGRSASNSLTSLAS